MTNEKWGVTVDLHPEASGVEFECHVVTEHSLSIGPTHGSMTPDLIDRIGRRPTALVLGEDRTGFDPATGDK